MRNRSASLALDWAVPLERNGPTGWSDWLLGDASPDESTATLLGSLFGSLVARLLAAFARTFVAALCIATRIVATIASATGTINVHNFEIGKITHFTLQSLLTSPLKHSATC